MERRLEEMETRDALLYAKTTTKKFAECAEEDTAAVGGILLRWCFLIIQPILVLPCLAQWLLVFCRRLRDVRAVLCFGFWVAALLREVSDVKGLLMNRIFGTSNVWSIVPGFFAVVIAAVAVGCMEDVGAVREIWFLGCGSTFVMEAWWMLGLTFCSGFWVVVVFQLLCAALSAIVVVEGVGCSSVLGRKL
ncbi:hypothetical protein Ancab_005568 [Ancistrocladus abbreviatus]